MEYKISDIAKMYGTTNEGIRFFEKKGLIKGKRDSKGYRVYTKRDLFALIQCLNYTKLGFTLKQAQELYSSEQISTTIQIFEQQIQKKESLLKQETVLLSCLKDRRDALEQAFLNKGRIIIERIPAAYVYKSNLSLGEGEVNETLYSPSMLALSPMTIGGVLFERLDDGRYLTPGKNCSYVNEQHVQELGIEIPPNAAYHPSCICATLVIDAGMTNTAEYDYVGTITELLEKEDLTPAGDIQVWYIFFNSNDDAQQRYCKIVVPIVL